MTAGCKASVCCGWLCGIACTNAAVDVDVDVDVCYGCCVLSGGRLCVGLISRPEDSNWVRCACVCEASIIWRSLPTRGCCAMRYLCIYFCIYKWACVCENWGLDQWSMHNPQWSHYQVTHWIRVLGTSFQFFLTFARWVMASFFLICCVFVCVRACAHLCMYVCMYACMLVRIYLCRYACM